MNPVILELQILKGEVYFFYEIVSIAVVFKFMEMFLLDSSFLLNLFLHYTNAGIHLTDSSIPLTQWIFPST